MSGRSWILTAFGLVAVAAGLFFLLRGTEPGGEIGDDGLPPRAEVSGQNPSEGRRPEIKTKDDVRPKAVRAAVKRPVEEVDEAEEDSSRTPAEKKLAADIEKALDEEDFELAKKCVPLALVCTDMEIRLSMVDTLGWFGEKAIPELTPFMADPDEDVADRAVNEWVGAVSAIESDEHKIGIVELALQAVPGDDALESIANEYIGVDEKLAVESLLRIIEGDGNEKGIVKAKETYETVTGEEFTDRAAAEKWLTEEYQLDKQEIVR